MRTVIAILALSVCAFGQLNQYKAWVYQSGGYPGAEMFVVFEDVRDKASADRKLKAILPGLDLPMERMR